MNVRPLLALGQALSGLAWVQGPGGNLSVKDARSLAVKASGTRLGDMRAPDALAHVPMTQARAALAGDPAATIALFDHAPRPSLETWLHALPGRYIVHTHPVGVLLLACCWQPALPGLAEVAPALPGRALALAMQACGDVDAWLLRKHGLVVRAQSAADALAQTRAIDAACWRLFGLTRRACPQVAPWQALDVPGGVVTALPPVAPHLPRYLFPDAAVLAAQTPVVALTSEAAAAKLRADPRPGVLSSPTGARWAVARHIHQLRDVVEVVTVHDWLLARLGADAVPLPDALTSAILDMPAERFRQLGATS